MTFFAVAAEPYAQGIVQDGCRPCLAGKCSRLPVLKLVVLDNVNQVVLGHVCRREQMIGIEHCGNWAA